jgi:hypothetical protein
MPMTPIPEPRPPDPPIDPTKDRVRFSFRHIRRKGDYSHKAFRKLPARRCRAICADFRRCARMTLVQFRSSNGVRLNKTKLPKFKIPDALSEDVRDQLWQYFRLSGKARAFGFIFDRIFFVVMIDADHEIHT